MLGIFRRHLKCCAHGSKGRKYLRCNCPVWVDGHLRGVEIHRSLGTSDWQKAQQIVRDWDADGDCPCAKKKVEPVTLEQGWQRFLAELESRKLQNSTVRKYRQLQRQMKAFAARNELCFLTQFDLEILDAFRVDWKDGPLSACKKLERLRAFFRFSHKRRWIAENPVDELKGPKVSLRPTMPFTPEETQRILAAVDLYSETTSSNGQENARRLPALVLLLRYSGMRISDVVSLSTERIEGRRLFLYTAKTGIPVHTVLPEFVVRVLESTPRCTEKFFFWRGVGKLDSAVRSWQTRLRKLFALAKVSGGHAHRFRDSFATALLLAGVPIERVAVLLGHKSVRVTEKHYSPWVRSRQEQLESDLEMAWSRDPLVLLESKVTRRLHGESEAVN